MRLTVALLAVLLPPSGASSMRNAIARRPALLRPLAALGATQRCLPRVHGRRRASWIPTAETRARWSLRLAGVRTPTRDVPGCYNREPGVKARAMLPRGTKVNVEGERRRRTWWRQVRERDPRAGGPPTRPRADGAHRWGRLPVQRSPRLKKPRKRSAGPLAALRCRLTGTGRDLRRYRFSTDATKDYGDAPTKYKSCAEFEYYEDAPRSSSGRRERPEAVRSRRRRRAVSRPSPHDGSGGTGSRSGPR